MYCAVLKIVYLIILLLCVYNLRLLPCDIYISIFNIMRLTNVFFLRFPGKAMQKQKSKNKLKPRELNRKGAEKEGTDMDAFVNTVSAAKTAEIKQDNKEQHAPAPKDSNKEPGREISKDIKEKDNYESKKEKEILPVHPKTEKHASTEVSKDSTPVQQASHVVDKPPASKESSIKSEDSAFNAVVASPNDVVDHAAIIEEMHLEALVAQKNEENFKVSALHASNDEKATTTVTSAITEKKQEVEVSSGSGNAPAEVAAPSVNKAPLLKYLYKEGQWSPVNMSGRKSYDRDFLLRLQFDPNSKQKPANLPNLQAVLKDSLQVWSRYVFTYIILYVYSIAMFYLTSAFDFAEYA